MASVLHAVGTPLQLVALFLLLVAGLTRLLVRSRAWKLYDNDTPRHQPDLSSRDGRPFHWRGQPDDRPDFRSLSEQ